MCNGLGLQLAENVYATNLYKNFFIHKTRSVFDRYNIVNDSDLKMAARLQEEYLSSATGTKSGTIVDFEEKKEVNYYIK